MISPGVSVDTLVPSSNLVGTVDVSVSQKSVIRRTIYYKLKDFRS
jgi:hypothetical protein